MNNPARALTGVATALALTATLATTACASHHRPRHHRAVSFACPTQEANVPGDPDNVVAPTAGGIISDADIPTVTADVRRSLQQSTKYLLTTDDADMPRVTSNNELAVRVPAMAAYTLAVALRTNGYAPSITGVTNTDAKAWAIQIINRVSCQQKDVTTEAGWGHGWQSAHWAYLAGTAGWLLWGDLTDRQRENVLGMVKGEADRLAAIPPTYWRTPSGTENYAGDSKAEELAWNAGLLLLGDEMVGNDLWRRQAAEYAAAAYSIKGDNTSSEVVNGVTMAQRVNGYNVLDSGAVVNHHIIHPDYANQVQLLLQAADLAGLRGDGAPEALFHNAGLVYSGLSTYAYTPGDTSPAGGTYVEPGGTVYTPGSPDIYFPQGTDWGRPRQALWVSLDAHADVYRAAVNPTGLDPADALALHQAGQTALQAASTGGRTYSADPAVAATQDSYPGREEYAASNMAAAWLALYLKQTGRTPWIGRSTLTMP